MREEPAGDFNYEQTGNTYSSIRQPEPRFTSLIRSAFGDAKSLLNVGAGAGSYEPDDMEVTAVEPSESMRLQRPTHLVTAIDAIAEDLPFPDDSFDASLASITIHQWRDLHQGLSEIRRVTIGPVVILTFEPLALGKFWLSEYAPELMKHECGRMPNFDVIKNSLSGSFEAMAVPIPFECVDGFAEAFFGRPEAFLDEKVRNQQSAWGFISHEAQVASIARLQRALEDGSWDEKHGALRKQSEYFGGLSLIVSKP